jgi:hypothetical protein
MYKFASIENKTVTGIQYAPKKPSANHILCDGVDVEIGDTYENGTFKKRDISQNEIERQWRDEELVRTDHFVALPDYPKKTQLIAYRQALRDWPESADFPDKKPVL